MISGCAILRIFFAFSIHSTTWDASSVSPKTHAMIFREYRSIMLVKYTKPSNVQRHPYSIRPSGIELFIQNVMQFRTEIRIYGCLYIWLNPLGFDSHLTHVIRHSFHCDFFAGFPTIPL